MKEKYTSLLNIIPLIFNLLVCFIIVIAGLVLINQKDTNGYFVLCIGLQFFIMRNNRNREFDN